METVTKKQTSKVGIINVLVCVPSYQRLDKLKKCLALIKKFQKPSNFYIKILVVDSGSDEYEFSKMADEIQDVEFKKIENRGYVGCVNEGLKYALKKNYDYMLVITDDAFVENNILTELIIPLAEDNQAAISGCKITHITIDKNNINRSITMAGGILGDGLFSMGKAIAEDCDKLTVCDWVNGAVVAMKVSVLIRIGLLDENFFMYFDELDLGLKLKRNGYHALYIPWVKVIHESGSSFYGITSKEGGAYARYYLTRNVAYLYYKISPLKFLFFLPYFLICVAGRATILLLKGKLDFSMAIIKGAADFFLGNFGRGPY